MISKELLSEVLNEEVDVIDIRTSIDDYSIPENEIRYYPALATGYASINIYELAYKCKDWALSKGYILQSWYKNCICINITDDFNKNSYYGDSEVEAIFKACEWILDNEEKIK